MDFLEGTFFVRARRMSNDDDDGGRSEEDFHLMQGMMMPFQSWSLKLIQFGEEEINFFSIYDCVCTLTGFARAWMLLLIFSSFFCTIERSLTSSSSFFPPHLFFFYIREVYTHDVLSRLLRLYNLHLSFIRSYCCF